MGDSQDREAPPQAAAAARGPQRRRSYAGAQNQKDENDASFVKASRGAPERMMSEDGTRIAHRRISSPPQVVHQRHMPVGTQKFHIPRKTREKLALFQPLSSESREYEDMLTILTSGYLDPASSGCFSYSKPRLVHSEALEKEFVEKRKELKADGRTEKELEESYCFMLADSYRLQMLCEKGLFVGQSWSTVLGNPQKGVYLSRCSDLLQMNPFNLGASGEIIIFKVIKGKVKSIYENMKNLLDPTPRFDSHLSKNISKVTSVMSYRAFELTQHYFYEYSFDELRQRPRQVCPYAVVSFQFKGRDTPVTSKPMAPLRLNSQSSEKSTENAQFTVWSGDLVKDDRVLFQVSLRSSSPPFLPHKLPERLEVQCVMGWDQVTRRLPPSLFSYNLYNNSSQEVEKDEFHCSLLEVVDRSRSMTSVTKLLQELESKSVVLVMLLSEGGFLFVLSSVQMALAHERGENWRRCLHALFVFRETRCPKTTPQSVCAEPSPEMVSADSVMPGLNHFVPALHFALGKARTNPPPELSTGVELQAREYISGIKDGGLRPYPMAKYEPELEQAGRQYPVPKLHRLGLDNCLRPYLSGPALYLLQMSRARAMVQPLCVRLNQARQVQATLNLEQGAGRAYSQTDQKMQQLIDLVLSCKRNAEKELQSEMKSGAKRKRLEQETAQRAIKHLKASQELQHLNAPQQQDATEVASSPSSLTSLIGSVGLKDTDLRDEGSELATKLLSLLTNLNQKATSENTLEPWEAGPKESSPFDKLALKLGLPTNCDIDLRKQEDFEGGSVSSQEGGFSPSGDPKPTHKEWDRDPRRRPKTAPVVEEEPPQPDIPWVLIPITGLPPVRYCRKDLPQDPRLPHLAPAVTPPPTPSAASATSLPTDTPPTATSCPAAPSVPPSTCTTPDPSPPASPSRVPSPDPSSPPSHCPSPEPEALAEPEPAPASTPERDEGRGEAFEVPQDNEEIPVPGDSAEPSPEEPPGYLSPNACSSSPSAQPSPRAPSTPKPPGPGEEDLLILVPMSPPLALQDIDSIVDHHLDSFCLDVQRLLQNKSVSCSLPQSPHSTSHPAGAMSQLSQYVSVYHPCPPVQRYVSSLQRQISDVLTDYANAWTPNRPDTTTATTTAAAPTTDLASRVSEFVASIRAANDDKDAPPEATPWKTDAEGQVASSSMGYLESTAQNDVLNSDPENEIDSFGEDVSSNGRRQVQFSSNHLEICIRNEPEQGSDNSRDLEEAGEANAASPPFDSDLNTLNSLIDQLQPEVFTNLVEIIKDLKRNAQHFYIHCTEEDDYVIQQIRGYLLKQSYIEKSPVVFLNQDSNSKGKLLVVIKNQDIDTHVHQIPELLSLKRRPSVQFLGVDSAEDLRNHSCQELFVSGGQVLSDEMVLNPDLISHDKLSVLLSILEKNSSSENLWRWKVHCKTHKKLKEQSRFRRDAASLLDVLLSYQRKQIVDFLPYHKCDMSQGCELLDCAIELQGRYSNYRHTVVLTENHLGNSSGGGLIVCGIEEFLHDFRKLVGYNDHDVPQPEEPQSTDDPSQSDLVPSEDQVSESIPLHSEQDFEVLHRAISQLRAERQQQLRDNLSDTDSDRQGAVSTTVSTTSVCTDEQRPVTPQSDKVSVTGAVQLTPGRQAVATTLDLIHSSLRPSNEDQTPDQARTQVQSQVQAIEPIQHRRSPELQETLDSRVGQQQSPDTEVHNSDRTSTHSRVQDETHVLTDSRGCPESKVPIDPTGHRTIPETQVQTIDQIPPQPGDQGQSQVPTDETQVQNLDQTSTQSEVPTEIQFPINRKQSPEPQVPTGLGGSQGSSVPSAPQKGAAIPGKSEPAAAPDRASAPNTSLNQSSVNQEKSPSTPPESRTQRKKRRKRKAEAAKILEMPRETNCLQLACADGKKLHPRMMFNPNYWDCIAMVREGFLPKRTPIIPVTHSKLAKWTAQSRVGRVVESAPGACTDGWWPARVTIYDSHKGPWALVEKIDQYNVAIPVFMMVGHYSPGTYQPFYHQEYNPQQHFYQHQYDEDRCDMVMYF